MEEELLAQAIPISVLMACWAQASKLHLRLTVTGTGLLAYTEANRTDAVLIPWESLVTGQWSSALDQVKRK